MSKLLAGCSDVLLREKILRCIAAGQNVECQDTYRIWLNDGLNPVLAKSGGHRFIHIILRGSPLSGKDELGGRIFDRLDTQKLSEMGLVAVVHNGILREKPQTILMLDMLKHLGHEIISIELDVEPHICFGRAKKRAEKIGRIDDMDEETVWGRINGYHAVAHEIHHEIKTRKISSFVVRGSNELAPDETYNEMLRQVGVVNKITLAEWQYRWKSYGKVPPPARTQVDWMRVGAGAERTSSFA